VTEQNQDIEIMEEVDEEDAPANNLIRRIAWIVIVAVIAFSLGFGSGYLKWGQDETAEYKRQRTAVVLYEQVNPAEGYALAVSYGDLGPQLVEAGVIDYDALAKVMADGGDALTNQQVDVLKQGRDEQIVITRENAHFLLNFFWAVGLANNNSILTQGPMIEYSSGQIDGYASTGGWTVGSKPVTQLYASMNLIPLTREQQALVEVVASAVYRPCCNNHTLFPDCNHGMAMLGLLQLMASKGATADEMFQGAKYVNAYWFPQQTLEIATYLKANQNIDFVDADARLVVGQSMSSASGAQMVRKSLQANGLLEQAPGQGGGCTN
jgi:hypothetical protein